MPVAAVMPLLPVSAALALLLAGMCSWLLLAASPPAGIRMLVNNYTLHSPLPVVEVWLLCWSHPLPVFLLGSSAPVQLLHR